MIPPSVKKNFVRKQGVYFDKSLGEVPRFKFMERLFESPFLYNFKMWACSFLNPCPNLNLERYVRNKKVLNVGTGPRTLYFDERSPKELVGFDVSPDFVERIQKQKGFYFVGSADRIPFPDKYFDTAVVFFVLHHLPFKHEPILKELSRVTRNNIIIYDHKLSDHPFKRFVQSTYWKIFDHGTKYNRLHEWKKLTKNFDVETEIFSGTMFENVVQYVLRVK